MKKTTGNQIKVKIIMDKSNISTTNKADNVYNNVAQTYNADNITYIEANQLTTLNTYDSLLNCLLKAGNLDRTKNYLIFLRVIDGKQELSQQEFSKQNRRDLTVDQKSFNLVKESIFSRLNDEDAYFVIQTLESDNVNQGVKSIDEYLAKNVQPILESIVKALAKDKPDNVVSRIKYLLLLFLILLFLIYLIKLFLG